MLFANYAQTFYKVVIIGAIILFIGAIIYSLVTRKKGTYNTFRDYFLPLDQVITPTQKARDSKLEAISRACLEKIYSGHEFKNIRPDWLINPETGKKLELDCYCEELKIAVEVQGVQHIKPVIGYFHKNIEDFEAQQARDLIKVEECVKRGIHLITIPFNVRATKACEYLMKELGKKSLLPKHMTGWNVR